MLKSLGHVLIDIASFWTIHSITNAFQFTKRVERIQCYHPCHSYRMENSLQSFFLVFFGALYHFSLSTFHCSHIQMRTVYCCCCWRFFELISNQNLPNNRNTHSKCASYPLDLPFSSRDVCILIMSMRLCRIFSSYLLFLLFSYFLPLFSSMCIWCEIRSQWQIQISVIKLVSTLFHISRQVDR